MQSRKTICPMTEDRMALFTASSSRISPTMMTSGACCKAVLRTDVKRLGLDIYVGPATRMNWCVQDESGCEIRSTNAGAEPILQAYTLGLFSSTLTVTSQRVNKVESSKKCVISISSFLCPRQSQLWNSCLLGHETARSKAAWRN